MAIGILWDLILFVGVPILWCCNAVTIQEASPKAFIMTLVDALHLPMGHTDPTDAVNLKDLMPWKDITVPSETVCAIHSHKTQATSFVYDDGVCSIAEQDITTYFNDAIYRPRLYPSPEYLEDVAFGKNAYSKSTYDSRFIPSKAVDGNDTTMFFSNEDYQSWFVIDLGEDRTVYQIHVLPRQNIPQRYHDVEYRIGNELRLDGNFSSYTFLHFYKGPYTVPEGRIITFIMNNVHGRFLSIQEINGVTGFLEMGDVKVFALKK